MALPKDKIYQVIVAKVQDEKERGEGGKGKSNCYYAEDILGNRSMESSIRRIYKGFKQDGHYLGVGLGEMVDNSKEEIEEYLLDEIPDHTLEAKIKYGDSDYANLAKRLLTAQRTNNQLRKIHRGTVGNVETQDKTFDEIIKGVVTSINKTTPIIVRKQRATGKHITAEILLSDIQYGKLMHGYNTQVAVARVKEYAKRIIERIEDYIGKGFVFDKIILAFLGDLIESDKKHDNSARSCDTGTAEQMKTAIENLFLDMVEPLALMGIPMDIVSITGNHDHDGHGLNMYLPGAQHLSWPLYHSLRMLTEAKGYTHVTHEIPDGCYAIKDIYGSNTLYEHGVKVSASEAAMSKRVTQRGTQIKKHIEYFRMGDKHTITRFSNDSKVVNGAFFATCDDVGGGEYSAISGYTSEPAQITLFHTPREDGRSSVCDSLVVQLGHITKGL